MWPFLIGVLLGLGFGYQIGETETKRKHKKRSNLYRAAEMPPPSAPSLDMVSADIKN